MAIGVLMCAGPEVIATSTAAMDPVEAATAMERVRTLLAEASRT